MESSTKPRHTLVVANLTASTPTLLQEVERRAMERPTTFELLIPNLDSSKYADWTLQGALKLLERAAGAPVRGQIGNADAYESVRQTLEGGSYDEIIISTLPKARSEWLKKDLPAQVEAHGIPVTVITPPEEPSPLKAFTDQFSAKTPPTAGA